MHAHAHALIECVFSIVRQEKSLTDKCPSQKINDLFYNGLRAHTHTGTCVLLRWEAASSVTKRRAVCPLPALTIYLSPSHVRHKGPRRANLGARRAPSNIAHTSLTVLMHSELETAPMLAGRAHRPRSRRCAHPGFALRRAFYIIARDDPQIHLCVLLSASSSSDDFVKFGPSPSCRFERASDRALAKMASDRALKSVPSSPTCPLLYPCHWRPAG